MENNNGNGNGRKIKLVIPKGKIYDRVKGLLEESGITLTKNFDRSYRMRTNIPWLEIKLLKPQNIGRLVDLGHKDIGFTGYDWIYEKDCKNVVEIFDTGFDPVKIVAAMPKCNEEKINRKEKIVIASEYSRITHEFLDKEGFKDYVYIQTYGATESFPPEDADMIIDNTSTGTTLEQNQLKVCKVIMESTTRFIANKDALNDSWKKGKIEELRIIFKSIIDAQQRVMIEMNVSEENLDKVIKVLPCMKSPTVNKLFEGGYAVKSAVPKKLLSEVIPAIKSAGATDILEFDINKLIA